MINFRYFCFSNIHFHCSKFPSTHCFCCISRFDVSFSFSFKRKNKFEIVLVSLERFPHWPICYLEVCSLISRYFGIYSCLSVSDCIGFHCGPRAGIVWFLSFQTCLCVRWVAQGSQGSSVLVRFQVQGRVLVRCYRWHLDLLRWWRWSVPTGFSKLLGFIIHFK